jgi:hypothetical protein
MVAYQRGIARHFGVEARDYKHDDDYEMAYWFKVGSKRLLYRTY